MCCLQVVMSLLTADHQRYSSVGYRCMFASTTSSRCCHSTATCSIVTKWLRVIPTPKRCTSRSRTRSRRSCEYLKSSVSDAITPLLSALPLATWLPFKSLVAISSGLRFFSSSCSDCFSLHLLHVVYTFPSSFRVKLVLIYYLNTYFQ